MKNQIQSVAKELLSNQNFVRQLKNLLFSNERNRQNSINHLQMIINDISVILSQLINKKIELEMNQIIEDNNKILRQIRNTIEKQKPVSSGLLDINQEATFSEVHRLMNEQKKKIFEEPNDAGLEKSISAFVDLKFDSLEEKVAHVDKRLKTMEDKYQTNLKSLWNVLSITQSALFDHLKGIKQKKECIITDEEVKKPGSILGFKLW